MIASGNHTIMYSLRYSDYRPAVHGLNALYYLRKNDTERIRKVTITERRARVKILKKFYAEYLLIREGLSAIIEEILGKYAFL